MFNAGIHGSITRYLRPTDSNLAVRVGFEPTVPVKVQRFSRPPDSTALAPHRPSILPFPSHLAVLFSAIVERRKLRAAEIP